MLGKENICSSVLNSLKKAYISIYTESDKIVQIKEPVGFTLNMSEKWMHRIKSCSANITMIPFCAIIMLVKHDFHVCTRCPHFFKIELNCFSVYVICYGKGTVMLRQKKTCS